MPAWLSDVGADVHHRALTARLLGAALLLAACGGGGEDDGTGGEARGDTTCDGRIEGTEHLTMWFHTGPSEELSTLRKQVAEFNRAQRQVRVELVTLPEHRPYTDLVNSATASGDLPDLLDIDGPHLYSYAWSGKLKPIDSCVPDSVRRDLLASIRQQGTYAGKLYGIGTFDSGLGLYVRPSVLEKAGIRIPRGVDDAWTSDEFTDVLRTLREAGHRTPVDIGLVHAQPGEEWNTYGFAPAVWSAGGDLIEPRTFRIIDIRMPPDHSTEGLKAARTIRERHPGTGILVLSAFVEVEDALELLAGGRGVGYLLKSRVTVVDEFIEALDRVGKGGAVVDPSLVHELFTAQRRDDPLSHLSSREREILALMAEGRSNAGIGRRLWVTEGTVEKHVRSILGNLGLTEDTDDHRRVLAVLTFLESR